MTGVHSYVNSIRRPDHPAQSALEHDQGLPWLRLFTRFLSQLFNVWVIWIHVGWPVFLTWAPKKKVWLLARSLCFQSPPQAMTKALLVRPLDSGGLGPDVGHALTRICIPHPSTAHQRPPYWGSGLRLSSGASKEISHYRGLKGSLKDDSVLSEVSPHFKSSMGSTTLSKRHIMKPILPHANRCKQEWSSYGISSTL